MILNSKGRVSLINHNKIKIFSVVVVMMLMLQIILPASALAEGGITRLWGNNRFATALQVAATVNTQGKGNVVLTVGYNFPDALAAGTLAVQKNAPILLLDRTAAESMSTLQKAASIAGSGGQIYLVGGTGVIGAEFRQALVQLGIHSRQITQIGGQDRYATSALVADQEEAAPGTPVFIASGDNYFDALAVSSLAAEKGYPLLLVNKNTLPSSVSEYLQQDQPSEAILVASPGNISASLRPALEALLPGKVKVVAGDSIYGTEAMLLSQFAPHPKAVYLATGADYADALTGSVPAAQHGAPLILLDPTLDNPPAELTDYCAGLSVVPITVIGGTAAMPDSLITNFDDLMGGIQNRVTAVNAVNGKITVTLSQAPINPPTSADFTVQFSINGGIPGTVVPLSIIENGNMVTLTVPDIKAEQTAQSVTYSVCYDGSPAVNAPSFKVSSLNVPDPNQSIVAFPATTALAVGSSYSITIQPVDASGNSAKLSGVPVVTWGTGDAAYQMVAVMTAPPPGSTGYTINFVVPLTAQNGLETAALTVTVGEFSVTSDQTYSIEAPELSADGAEIVPTVRCPSTVPSVTKNFTWQYDFQTYTWTVQVPEDLLTKDRQENAYATKFFDADGVTQLKMFQNASPVLQNLISSCFIEQNGDYRVWVTDNDNEAFVRSMAQALDSTAQVDGDDTYEEANFFLSFVAGAIPYKLTDVPELAAQTVVDAGDCKDTSILLAGLLQAVGYQTALISFPPVPGTNAGHMTAGIALSDSQVPSLPDMVYYTQNGVNYYNAETTAPGLLVGEAGNFSGDENNLENSGYVFPLN